MLVFLWCCTIVPMPASWDIRGWAETNPLNGPVWSLQWEYLANILYALVIRRFTKLWLTVCVVLFGVMTLLLCLNVDWLGVWENRTAEAFTVIGGWSLSPDQLLIGSTRLLYPFFAGLLLSRANRLIKVRGGFWLCSALIAAVLVMPRVGGTDSLWMNGVYEAVVILLLFPFIVSVGREAALQVALLPYAGFSESCPIRFTSPISRWYIFRSRGFIIIPTRRCLHMWLCVFMLWQWQMHGLHTSCTTCL